MVRFIDTHENRSSAGTPGGSDTGTIAPVTYLPGVVPVVGQSVVGQSVVGQSVVDAPEFDEPEFDEPEFDKPEFQEADADPDAIETSLVRKLARRAMSEAEILAFGVAEGLTAHQANSILDRLRGFGYVDDRVLAEQMKHALYERKGQSRAVVARAMSGRSIERDIIDEVLDDIDQSDELTAATEIAAKRASQLTGLDKQTLERRLVGYLARRGYPGNIVREAIAPLLTGRSSSSSTVRFR